VSGGPGVSGGPAVIVDPFSSGGMYAPAFLAASVPVVAVLSRPTPPPVYAPSFHPEDFSEVIAYEGDLDDVVRRVGALAPRCVLPGADSGVELADALAARVTPALANVPGLASARRHKWDMAQALAAVGLPIIPQVCTADPDEVDDWIKRENLAGQDLVVKPPKSASTDGVTRVPGGVGWRRAFDAQLGRPNQWDVINERMLVQVYATGTEYVVDTFSHDGRHTVTDVCQYHKVDNGTHMAVYDSMRWVPPDEHLVADLVAYTAAALDAVGLRFGAAHTEVMWTADGPRLVEINARPHGGGQPRFCRVATGDSQVDRAVRLFTGQGTLPAGYELRQHLVVVFLISRAAGTLRNVEILDAVQDLPSHHYSEVNVHNGDAIGVTQDLLDTLALGFVILSHPDADQVTADHHTVRSIESSLLITA
jgi:biotin carboxylase